MPERSARSSASLESVVPLDTAVLKRPYLPLVPQFIFELEEEDDDHHEASDDADDGSDGDHRKYEYDESPWDDDDSNDHLSNDRIVEHRVAQARRIAPSCVDLVVSTSGKSRSTSSAESGGTSSAQPTFALDDRDSSIELPSPETDLLLLMRYPSSAVSDSHPVNQHSNHEDQTTKPSVCDPSKKSKKNKKKKTENAEIEDKEANAFIRSTDDPHSVHHGAIDVDPLQKSRFLMDDPESQTSLSAANVPLEGGIDLRYMHSTIASRSKSSARKDQTTESITSKPNKEKRKNAKSKTTAHSDVEWKDSIEPNASSQYPDAAVEANMPRLYNYPVKTHLGHSWDRRKYSIISDFKDKKGKKSPLGGTWGIIGNLLPRIASTSRARRRRSRPHSAYIHVSNESSSPNGDNGVNEPTESAQAMSYPGKAAVAGKVTDDLHTRLPRSSIRIPDVVADLKPANDRDTMMGSTEHISTPGSDESMRENTTPQRKGAIVSRKGSIVSRKGAIVSTDSPLSAITRPRRKPVPLRIHTPAAQSESDVPRTSMTSTILTDHLVRRNQSDIQWVDKYGSTEIKHQISPYKSHIQGRRDCTVPPLGGRPLSTRLRQANQEVTKTLPHIAACHVQMKQSSNKTLDSVTNIEAGDSRGTRSYLALRCSTIQEVIPGLTLLVWRAHFHPGVGKRFQSASIVCKFLGGPGGLSSSINKPLTDRFSSTSSASAFPSDPILLSSTASAIVKNHAPRRSFGGSSSSSQQFHWGVELPISAGAGPVASIGITPSAAVQTAKVVQHAFTITGSARGIPRATTCVWTVEENGSSRRGIPSEIEFASLVEHDAPFACDVDVEAKLGGGLLQKKLRTKTKKKAGAGTGAREDGVQQLIDPARFKGLLHEYNFAATEDPLRSCEDLLKRWTGEVDGALLEFQQSVVMV